MSRRMIQLTPRRLGIVLAVVLATSFHGLVSVVVQAQSADSAETVPDISGVWDGSRRARPIISATVPWAKTVRPGTPLPDGTVADKNYVSNYPELNERALAFQRVFDEALSPKYDCQPLAPPTLVLSPFSMEITQWPDRVLLRYEKDDQLRTVWLDGREPTARDYGLQGFSVGRYEGNALVVITTHFVFDIIGFHDMIGVPSSTMKKVTERYWRDGDQLKATITIEDPLFLRMAASVTTRWLPSTKGYKLKAWDCDPETSRLSTQFIPTRYK